MYEPMAYLLQIHVQSTAITVVLLKSVLTLKIYSKQSYYSFISALQAIIIPIHLTVEAAYECQTRANV